MDERKIELIKEFFKVGEIYSREIIEQVLEYKPNGSVNKGVLGGHNVGYLCLMVTLQKFENNKDFTDHIAGSMLFWSGQRKPRSAEKAVKNKNGRFFIFVRARLSDCFIYYGEAQPVRLYEKDEGVPSDFVFNLEEYYSSDYYKLGKMNTVTYNPVAFRDEALRIWNYRCSTSLIDNSSLLVTRHIQPVEETTYLEAQDPKNSLVLTPDMDNLFFRGIISFSPSSGKIILPRNSNLLRNLELMHIDSTCELRDIPTGTEKYLLYHNTYIFNYVNFNNLWQFK